MNNSLNGIDVVYYINLDRSTERKSYMETTVLNNHIFDSIHIVRISGVDGKNEAAVTYTDAELEMTPELGCLLSHLNTIRKFNDSEYDVALIFEDDVSLDFQSKWKKTAKQIMMDAPYDWEIIQLSYIGSIPDEDYSPSVAGTAAYVINKRGAHKLMSNVVNHSTNKYNLDTDFYRNNRPADFFIFNSMHSYRYIHPMFTYRDNNDSTIHPEHLPMHNERKLATKTLLETYIPYFEPYTDRVVRWVQPNQQLNQEVNDRMILVTLDILPFLMIIIAIPVIYYQRQMRKIWRKIVIRIRHL